MLLVEGVISRRAGTMNIVLSQAEVLVSVPTAPKAKSWEYV
jgi:hypothetical protein